MCWRSAERLGSEAADLRNDLMVSVLPIIRPLCFGASSSVIIHGSLVASSLLQCWWERVSEGK